MDMTTRFDKRLQFVPDPWRDALVEVIDTAEAICLGLQQPDFDVANPAIDCPQLVAELTRLACERKDASRTGIGKPSDDPDRLDHIAQDMPRLP